uniref:hypothetical protein n=1 Tax=Olsenella uli TaxID=133926 RepID=UPI0028E3C07C|nr:hypothetical protein [Olsenella uli]
MTGLTEFLTGNEWWWRLARTVAQGVLGVIVANLDLIVGTWALAPKWRALVVALVMAMLSPVMAEIGRHVNPAVEEGGSDE